MEQVALQLETAERWTWLGGDDGARKAPSVVLRALDAPVLFTVGDRREEARPDAAVLVPAGEGRRLTGLHFFARAERPGPACRITIRGI